ncbi:NIPSNAP family protein [Streptomyces sp. NBRC 109706]|uniref:NIPSNAP family protein n=1 Tax=Streptomyces sp. NBRC 109706 TaxID=1550035 RepID=UPI000784FCD1|nr:NIPSNAP family protein [Streptomyces sp. NBRC 109706]
MDVPRCPVVELRQYTLHPGRRDELIELFDREFVESQEAVGATVLGQFRDLDDPDRFVWLRGFADMAGRCKALEDFYGGPVWREHRDRANATMVDSDDVLLLRPASPDGGFPPPAGPRPAPGEPAPRASSLILATVCHGDNGDNGDNGGDGDASFERRLRPLLAESGGEPLACLRSEHARNTFPALPVRTGEEVVVRFARFGDERDLDDHLRRLDRSAAGSERWPRVLQRLRLVPTERSTLR